VPIVTEDIARRLLCYVRPGIANVADKDSKQSVDIAEKMIRLLWRELPGNAEEVVRPAQTRGASLEDEVKEYLTEKLSTLDPTRAWTVTRGQPISQFKQYKHLATVRRLVQDDQTGVLRDTLGADYVIAPDVVVAEGPLDDQVLHASVSCKWTIRSDRVQNARHEANILIRHRRGRAPHIVAVTAEPLPTRLASIARGTGEIDATYHIALPALRDSVSAVGNRDQQSVLEELVANSRLSDLASLPHDLLH